MIIKNPLEVDVNIAYKGHVKSIEAGGELVVSKDLAEHWIGVHAFLILEEEKESREEPPKTELYGHH